MFGRTRNRRRRDRADAVTTRAIATEREHAQGAARFAESAYEDLAGRLEQVEELRQEMLLDATLFPAACNVQASALRAYAARLEAIVGG